MSEIVSDRVGPMQNSPHLGELIRKCMDDVGWNVTETAARLAAVCASSAAAVLLDALAPARCTSTPRGRKRPDLRFVLP